MLHTAVGQLRLDNPILSASGTYGSGLEAADFGDLSRLGALVSKTVTLRPRPGNPPPRIVETPAGMLNSIGLENRGVDRFLAETLPRMRAIGPKVVVNIGGETLDEFEALAERVSAAGVDALELNLSCPNVQGGRLFFSTVPRQTEEAVRRAKRAAGAVPVWAKLSPNVTDIVEIARAAEQGGADALTAINTLIGMAVDWRRRRPVLGRVIGGLSGPAIKPVALRLVREIVAAVRIPVVGVGGVCSAEDVLEFLVVGSCAVQVGTACFADPLRPVRILDEMAELLRREGLSVEDLRGTLQEAPDAAATPVRGEGA